MATVVVMRRRRRRLLRRHPTRQRRVMRLLRRARDGAKAAAVVVVALFLRRNLVRQCRPGWRIGIRRRSGPYPSVIRWAPLPLELEMMDQRMVLLLHRHPLAMPRMAVAEIGSSSREDVADVANGIVAAPAAAVVEPGVEEAEADMMGVGAMAVAGTGSSREAGEAGAEEVVTDGATTPAEVDMTVVEQVEGGLPKAVEAEVTGTKEVAVDG
mmetsp:Transcript_13170/g.27886  ORF Transcript_13170/g.27886 Transcript_13170/m.27886 type:complete len:212 (-) Transcript_13170:374-1009(-)